MINIPKPPDDLLINEIMDELEFFSHTQMLFFERAQIFQSDVVTTHTSAINEHPPGKFSELHPQYDPGNLAPQNVVRAGQVANPHDIDFRALKESRNSVFFVLSELNHDVWIIGLPYAHLIYHTNNHKIRSIPLSCGVSLNKRTVTFAFDDGYTLSLNIKIAGGSSTKRGINEACALFRDGISDNNFKSFELFFRSFCVTGGFPPIKHSLLSFYRSIVENIQFLYIFSTSMINIAKVDESIVSAWLEAAGHNIITLIPLMVFNHLESVNDPSSIFETEVFLTILYTKIIEKDSSFLHFLNNFNVQADDLIDEFLSDFENVELQPLSQFILHHLYMGCVHKFQGTNAHHLAVSYALFTRVMMPFLNAKHPNLISRLATLIPLFDIIEGKVGLEKAKRFKDLMEQFEQFPHSFGMIMSPETCENSVSLLIGVVHTEPDKFYKAASQTDLVKLANLFYKSTHGRNPSDVDKKQAPQSNLMRKSYDDFDGPNELSNFMDAEKNESSDNS